MKHHFDISRFWLLLKMEIIRNRKGVYMTLVIVLGISFFLGLLLTPVLEPALIFYTHSSGYAFLMLTTGFILSGMAFRDLGNPLKRANYLMLPVSNLERFLVMWLLTSIGWVVLFTLVYTIYSLFANTVGQIIFSHITYEKFQPVGPFAVKIIQYYLVLQGIFLAGAAQFRGYPFPKTLLTIVLFAAVCGGIAYLIMKDSFDFDWETDPDAFTGMPVEYVWNIIEWMFWWLLAPLSWLITYLGLKEQEV